MKLMFDPIKSKNVTQNYIIYGAVAIILSLLQISLLNLIEVKGITPDLLLILVVWITLAEGQFTGLFFGFGIGLLFDFITLDVIGTNALTKTIAAFFVGYFYKEGYVSERLGSFFFVLITLVTAVIHNLIYYIFYIRLSDLNYLDFFIRYGLATSAYTGVFAIIAMLLNIPRKQINR